MCPACANGQECIEGQCRCTPTSCPNGCCEVDTCREGNTDDACGIGDGNCDVCPGQEVCQGRQCVASCPSGQTDCAGVCADTSRSRTNCGGCGRRCKRGAVCRKGR